VAKRLESLYIEGRNRDWSKLKVNQEDEFIIVGCTEPRGSREYFGALFLGAYKARKLLYVGKVGTGFNRNNLASLYHSRSSEKHQLLKIFLTEPSCLPNL
jgi:bifunctional non-homologous end joining protein LigD